MLIKRKMKSDFAKLTKEGFLHKTIYPGLHLNKGCLCFNSKPSGRPTLTNYYELTLDEKLINFSIGNVWRPQYPYLFLKSIKIGALINAGFYLQVDDLKGLQPINFSQHLLIINQQLINLSTRTKTALIEKNHRLQIATVQARGQLYFNQMPIPFIGSHDFNEQTNPPPPTAIVYGLTNQGLIKNEHGIIIDGQRQQLPPRKGYQNIIMGLRDKSGQKKLYIKKITNQTINFLAGAFILQTPNNLAKKLRLNQVLTDWQVDKLTPQNITSAITVGVPITNSIDKLYQQLARERLTITRNVNQQAYYTTENDLQKARSCIIKTKDHKIHFLLIDARPKIAQQQGMSYADLVDYLYQKYPNISWAVNCDGGQSSKLIIKQNNKIKPYGNLHYLNLIKSMAQWDGWRGRPITSCVIANPKNYE